MTGNRKYLFSIAAILIGVALAFLLAAGLPYLVFFQQANSAFQDHHSLWLEKGSRSYDMVVYSNSYTQASAGRNDLQVREGLLVKALNPDCPNCPLTEFEPLTVEALFERVETECLGDFPIQFCNVSYDPVLGYPRRLDTYPYNRAGRERPSITVTSVIVVDAK